MVTMLEPSATPFFYPGGSPGCLLIHGFTGSPKEMQPLGEFLTEQGYAALGVRLFAHATTPQDMNRAHWEDWVACVEDGWHYLKGITDEIVLIGLSMGGVLALHQAVHLPVIGVVAMSTPYHLISDPRLPLIKYFWRFVPFLSKGESDWQDRTQTEEHFSYDQYPTRAIVELSKLLEEMRASLAQIPVPTLLIHSRVDMTVPPENAAQIYEELKLAEDMKDIEWIEQSGHVLTRDTERGRVYERIQDFILRLASEK